MRKEFVSSSKLAKHKKTNPECEYCGKTFKRFDDFQKHVTECQKKQLFSHSFLAKDAKINGISSTVFVQL